MQLVSKIKEKRKTRSTKLKNPLIEYKTGTDINQKLTGNSFPSFFIKSAPEVYRNKVK